MIEADEYDTAFFDKRSKFVHYRPRTAILNNLEYDHADIFPTSRRSRRSSITWCAPCRGRAARRQRRRGGLARVLARGAGARSSASAPRIGRGTRSDWTIADDGAIARRRAAGHARVRAGRAPQPAERARRDRRGAPRRRAGRAGTRGARAFRGRQAADGGARRVRRHHRLRRLRASSDGDRDDASTGLRRSVRGGAHPRRARAALEHDEARHDEGGAAGRASRRPIACLLLRGEPRLGRRARRWRRSARAPTSTTTSPRSSTP